MPADYQTNKEIRSSLCKIYCEGRAVGIEDSVDQGAPKGMKDFDFCDIHAEVCEVFPCGILHSEQELGCQEHSTPKHQKAQD